MRAQHQAMTDPKRDAARDWAVKVLEWALSLHDRAHGERYRFFDYILADLQSGALQLPEELRWTDVEAFRRANPENAVLLDAEERILAAEEKCVELERSKAELEAIKAHVRSNWAAVAKAWGIEPPEELRQWQVYIPAPQHTPEALEAAHVALDQLEDAAIEAGPGYSYEQREMDIHAIRAVLPARKGA